MAENKKSATEATEKVLTKYDKKLQKRKEAEEKAKKEKMKSRLISAAVVIVLIAIVAYFPIRKSIALSSTYMQVGEEKVTELEFEYYYNLAVNNFISENSYWLSYIGFDSTKDYADQQYSEHLTWDDYFQESAVANMKQVKALAKAATEAGFEYDTTADVENHIEMLEEAAAEQDMTVKNYVKASLGEYATTKNLKDIIAESYYASAYYNEVIEGLDITEEEITNYYNENTASYDSVDFKLITVEAEIPEGEKTTDAEGNETTADPTEEQIKEAMDAAKIQAEEKLLLIDTEGEANENVKKSGVSSYYADWLFDESRKAGDTTIIENETTNAYYVLKFEDRYLDETKAVNIRAIATTTDQSTTIMDEWKNTGANEEAFIALVEKYSEDTYTNRTGGLYENLQASTLSETLSSWLLDESRAAGDVEALTASDGYFYVMYYMGQGDAEWKASIDSLLRNEDMGVFMDEIMEGLEIVDTKGKLTYQEAVAAQESAAAESEEASTEATE